MHTSTHDVPSLSSLLCWQGGFLYLKEAVSESPKKGLEEGKADMSGIRLTRVPHTDRKRLAQWGLYEGGEQGRGDLDKKEPHRLFQRLQQQEGLPQQRDDTTLILTSNHKTYAATKNTSSVCRSRRTVGPVPSAPASTSRRC